jgi:hypothetical protein
MVDLLSKIKGGVLTIHPAFSIWILIVTVSFILIFFLRHKLTKFFHSRYFVWSMFFLACACFTVWSIYLHKPDGRLHFHLVRCEDEVTLFLQTPGGETLVLDPRGSVNELASTLESTLSPWEFHVDAVLLTDQNSTSALSKLAERITVKKVLLAPAIYRLEKGGQSIIIPGGINIEKILPGQKIEIEPGVSISLVSESLQGTALLMEYDSLKVLIPNGVDYAAIKTDAPESMQGVTALVLSPQDISYIPPRVWQQLNPDVILWNDISLSPFVNSIGVDDLDDVSLVSNGKEFWIKP